MTQHALIIAAMVIGVWLAADIAALIWLAHERSDGRNRACRKEMAP